MFKLFLSYSWTCGPTLVYMHVRLNALQTFIKMCQDSVLKCIEKQYHAAAVSVCGSCKTLNRSHFVNHHGTIFRVSMCMETCTRLFAHRNRVSIVRLTSQVSPTQQQNLRIPDWGRVRGCQVMIDMHKFEAWSCIFRGNLAPCQLCSRRVVAQAIHRNSCAARRRADKPARLTQHTNTI